ncbi:MAG: hypothetical protein IMW86_04665 [Hydrogenibacillus sp.]|nr:hypothetical protein [Hydrogenibacillus sp.]
MWTGMKTLARQYGGLFLIGAGINGGISLLQGNHGKTLLRDALVGGVAGMIGASVGNGVAKGAFALFGKVAGKLPVRTGLQNAGGYLLRMLGAGAGSASDSVAEDVLHRRKIDWKKAATSFAMAIGMLGMMGLVHGGLLSGIQKGPWDSSISAKAEQQSSVQAVKKTDEVALGAAVEKAKGIINQNTIPSVKDGEFNR